MSTYTVLPLGPILRKAVGATHGVYAENEVGRKAIALCYNETDAQRIAALLNGVPLDIVEAQAKG